MVSATIGVQTVGGQAATGSPAGWPEGTALAGAGGHEMSPQTLTPRRGDAVRDSVRRAGTQWWRAVNDVHTMLTSGGTDLETMRGTFDSERALRQAFADSLHSDGREVPDYLAPEAVFVPLWPTPELPPHR